MRTEPDWDEDDDEEPGERTPYEDEVRASGSRDPPDRAVIFLPMPSIPAYTRALSSHELPPKVAAEPSEGIDQLGPWIQPSPDEVLYRSLHVVHMRPTCNALPLACEPISMCFCVKRIHKRFHYMVGYNGELHQACGCALDVAPEPNWANLQQHMVRICHACFTLAELD